MVVHRAFNVRVVMEKYSPFTQQVYPDTVSSARDMTEYLLHLGRTDYVGLLYAFTDTGIERNALLGLEWDRRGILWQSHSYVAPVFSKNVETEMTRLVSTALAKLKETGYRTIVVAMEQVRAP